jgi:hypothetical protein
VFGVPEDMLQAVIGAHARGERYPCVDAGRVKKTSVTCKTRRVAGLRKMMRPLFVFIVAAIVMYIITRFRHIDERLVIMRRSLDTRITDADVQSIMAMVREHIGGELQTRLETLEERVEYVEETIGNIEMLPRVDFEKNESVSSPSAPSLPASISAESDDEQAPPGSDAGEPDGDGADDGADDGA